MKINGLFNWDKYWMEASFQEILHSVGQVIGASSFTSYPTTVSPCGQFIYFHSLDDECRINDYEELRTNMSWLHKDRNCKPYNFDYCIIQQILLDAEEPWCELAGKEFVQLIPHRDSNYGKA
jgi:hypothetical protein